MSAELIIYPAENCSTELRPDFPTAESFMHCERAFGKNPLSPNKLYLIPGPLLYQSRKEI